MKLPNFLQIIEWKLFFRAFKRFLYASRISIFICLIVVILLTLSFQSIEIIVEFMQNPINLALFWPIFILLAIVISHYPSYLDMKNQMDFSENSSSTPKVKWIMNTPLLLRWLPENIKPWIGIISYEKPTDHTTNGDIKEAVIKNCKIEDGKITSGQLQGSILIPSEKQRNSTLKQDQVTKIDEPEKSNDDKNFRFLKHWLGSFFLSSFLFILLKAYNRLIEDSFSPIGIFGIFLIFSFAFSRYISKSKLDKNFLLNVHFLFSIISVLLYILLIISSHFNGWSPKTFWLFVALNVTATINFTLFRFLRSNLKDVIDKKFENKKTLMQIKNSRAYTWKDIKGAIIRTFFSPAQQFETHVNFLNMMHLGGAVTLALLVFSNIYPSLFSPVVIILCSLYTLYGLIIHPMKHRIYYEQQIHKDEPSKWKRIFGKTAVRLIPILPMLFIIYSLIPTGRGAELHTLDYVTEDTNKCVNETEFLQKFETSLKSNTKDSNIYFIATYGGGLTANVWTNYVLDSLNGRSILDNTVSISGVSGGGMGQGIYAAIKKRAIHENDEAVIRRVQDSLSTNFLSRDLAWLLGWDLIREYYSFGDVGKDRAKKSLDEYADLVNDPEMNTLSYREYWAEMQKGDNYFPMLLTNTMGKNNVHGVSASVKFNDFTKVFPGYINVLSNPNHLDSSLCYLQAMSTTNRFPIISPQAKITPHGYFADAGYYENSGMLSQYKLYQYLKEQEGWDTLFQNRKVVFIQIMNTTSSYLNDKIDKREENIKELADASEVMAIVSTMIELNSTPFLINRTIKNLGPNVSYVPIALPFPIEEDDVKSFLGAKELMPSTMSQFCCYNARINKIRLNEGSLWETTFPSTSRLVVKQSSKYMRKCLEDGIVFQELDDFFEKKRGLLNP